MVQLSNGIEHLERHTCRVPKKAERVGKSGKALEIPRRLIKPVDHQFEWQSSTMMIRRVFSFLDRLQKRKCLAERRSS